MILDRPRAPLFLALLLSPCNLFADALRAGAFAVDVTPQTFPIFCSGNFLPRAGKFADGNLFIRALVLDDGQTKIAIAVADSLMMPRSLLDRAKQLASARSGIPADRMLISATHTHSAPPVMGALGTDLNEEYARMFQDALVNAIAGAAERLRPARIGWKVVQDYDHTHCRRWIMRTDRIRTDPFGVASIRANMHPGYQSPDFVGPSGPVDPDLSLISLQTVEGRPIALLANYSMHYIGAAPGAVSPDYYGPFARNMERLIGRDGEPAFVAMMSQGTSGDQQWMDYSKPQQKTTEQTYAAEMAAIAHAAYKTIQYRTSAPLAISQATLRLVRRVPDAQRLAWAKETLAKVGEKPLSNIPEVMAREQLLVTAEPERELILQAVRIGDLAITAIPDEVFALTGLKLKAQSPLTPTVNIELANGAEGYIPPPEQHALGGYTTWAARTAGLEVQAEPKIVETVLGLLEQVAGKPRRKPQHADGAYAKAILAAKPLAYWRGTEFSGPMATDASGHGNHARYQGRVAFYLDGPPSRAFSEDQVNRAPQFAGGNLKATLAKLPATYTVEMWFYNGLPGDARPLIGYLYSRGEESLGISGTGSIAGRLRFQSASTVFEGKTAILPNTWNYVALVRGSGSLQVFLNGSSEPEISQRLPKTPVAAPDIYLAGAADGSNGLEGRMDEISVYPVPLAATILSAHHKLLP
jgi:hypothetical protein